MKRLAKWLLTRPLRARAPRRTPLRVEALEDRLVPTGRPLPFPVIFAGADAGAAPVVRAYAADTGALNFERTVFEPTFTGGVRVATADFNHDGFPDVVVAAGDGGGPRVRVLDGKTGEPLPGPVGDFLAYEPGFRGGLFVAAADVDGDGVPDVITAAGQGGGPRVRVFSGADGHVLADFFALDPEFRGGLSVAAADLTGDGKAVVAVGAGAGGGPRVEVLDPLTGSLARTALGDFFAFDPASRGGVSLGADSLAGDVDGDGTPDLVVGTGPGVGSQVRVFSGRTGGVVRDFSPFGVDMTAGVSVAAAYVDDDAFADVVVGTGPGVPTTVRVFSGATGELLPGRTGEFAPFGAADAAGVFVAASNDPGGTTLLDADYILNTPPNNPNGQATLHLTVTYNPDEHPGRYLWVYTVTNDTFSGIYGDNPLVFLHVDFNTQVADAADWASSTGEAGFANGTAINAVGLNAMNANPGQSAWLSFTTPPTPIDKHAWAETGLPATGVAVSGEVAAPGKPPTIAAAYGTTLIPVNADNDNGSKWKSAALPFIPSTRDFDAVNLPVDDPELIPVTVTIGGGYAGTLSVSDYAPGEATVAFWADKKKQAAFASKAVPAGNDPATVTFYVEGTHESLYAGDTVRIDLTFTLTDTPQVSVQRSDTVQVAPIINSFTATIPNPSVRFVNLGPPADGLAGLIASKPDGAGGFIPGIVFNADITNGPLTIKDVGNFRDVVNKANGTAAGGVFVAGSGLANQNYLPNVGSGFTFPGLDSFNPDDPTDSGDLFTSTPNPPNGVLIRSEDSPSTGWPANSDKLDTMDVKYLPREYLVVRYADKSIYPIAYWDWNVNFYATTNVAGKGVSVIAAASKVSTEGDFVRSNADPLKTAGPIFNGNTGWR
jgi:hypothetical protein